MFDQILKALGGGNLGDIEKNVTDLLGRLEKLGADVIGSNGNVIAALVAVGEDFATLKQTVADVRAIVDDLKAIHAGVSAAPVSAPAPVSVASIIQAAASALTGVDPFAPKPLPHLVPQSVLQANEPRGGA